MSDFSFYDPPIEVAAASPRLEMIVARLKSSGLRPYLAAAIPDVRGPDPLLIDLETAPGAMIEHLSRQDMAADLRQIVFLGAAGESLSQFDEATHLRRDEHLIMLKSRLNAITRRVSRQHEATIRQATAAELGVEIPGPDPRDEAALLYLGTGSPNFLALQHALRQCGIEITAALSRQTARQHASGRRFTAALIDLEMADHDAGSVCRWVCEEAGLTGLPLIVVGRNTDRLTERQAALLSHASEMIDADSDISHVASQIHTHCARLRAGAPMMPLPGLALAVTDIVSGLFCRHFFEAHLRRQMEVATDRAEPMSVLTLCLNAEVARSRTAQALAGGVVLNQIRETDCPALVQPGVIAISLPATPYRGAVRLAERIDSTLAHKTPEHSGLNWRVVERRSYHTAKTLLGAALVGPFIRTRIAA